jgi:hypothetical protein
MKLFNHESGLASTISDPIYKKFHDIYISLGLFGLFLAAGIAFATLLWDRRPSHTRVVVFFWVFFALVLPLSVLNYWSSDTFVSRGHQTIVDIILVFLGLTTATFLFRFQLRQSPRESCSQWLSSL